MLPAFSDLAPIAASATLKIVSSENELSAVTPDGVIDAGKAKGSRFWIFALLALFGEFLLYFSNAAHFFQADTVFWFDRRLRSFSEFARSFLERDPGGWYRPLTARTVESLFFPVFGLHPVPYHLVLFPLFALDTAAVYCLTFLVTRRRLAAALATVFFSIHTINAYVTYDVAFVPELVYTFFYIAGIIAAIIFIRSKKPLLLAVSAGLFVLSLLSKEAAITFPFTLMVVCFWELRPEIPDVFERAKKTLSAARIHLVILGIYLLFAIGYLRVGGTALDSLLMKPEQVSEPQYNLVLDPQVLLSNADLALSWAFNLPRGWQTQWRDLSRWMIVYLRVFRFGALALIAYLLMGKRRAAGIVGAAWFMLTCLPMLPLFNHFLPYYLFLPLAGFSIVVGAAFDNAYQALKGFKPFKVPALMFVFAMLALVCAVSIRHDRAHNVLLGGSAELALQSEKELHRMYPSLKEHTKILFLDHLEPDLAYSQGFGGLVRLSYADDTLEAVYSSDGVRMSLDEFLSGRVLVVKAQGGHLSDETAEALVSPEGGDSFFQKDAAHLLSLSATSVVAGRDSYTVTIPGLSNVRVRFFYTFNGGPPISFFARLNEQGEVSFDVDDKTPVGDYWFFGYQVEGAPNGIRADARITVQPRSSRG
jgi:hypothetical protein